MNRLDPDVTRLIESERHPLAEAIADLRTLILSSDVSLSENVKWNSPNYSVGPEDRITLRIRPPKRLQLVFHCGAKVREQPKARLMEDPKGLLDWKENDRATLTLRDREDVRRHAGDIIRFVRAWLRATGV